MFCHIVFGSSEAVRQLMAAEKISTRVSSLILQLDSLHGWVPDMFDDTLEELRGLFDSEEILMIRSRYPDYMGQQLAHRFFIRRMLSVRENDLIFNGMEHRAADWLSRHERTTGRAFLLYLKDRTGEKASPAAYFSPDTMILPMKIEHRAE